MESDHNASEMTVPGNWLDKLVGTRLGVPYRARETTYLTHSLSQPTTICKPKKHQQLSTPRDSRGSQPSPGIPPSNSNSSTAEDDRTCQRQIHLVSLPLRTREDQARKELISEKILTVRSLVNTGSPSDKIPGIIEFASHKVIRNDQEVVKSGPAILAQEGRALQFASSLHLPVPALREVHALDRGTMIKMDFVDGECLEEAWRSLDGEQKQGIAEQLRDILTTMRQATPTQNTIGAFGGPAHEVRLYSSYDGGPFNTEAEFNDFILDLVPGTPSMVRDAFVPLLGVNSKIVFTHASLSPQNIIVKEGRIQALLGWSCAGWYPEYWEYVKFVDRPTSCEDWKEYAATIFETQYPQKLVTFQALKQWQFP